MALVAEFTTARETFAIGRALEGTSGLTVELERVIPTGESVVPYYWVWGDDLPTYEQNLSSEPDVETVEAIARTDGGTLYRICWQNEMSSAIHDLFTLDFALLSGVCAGDNWDIEVRFPSSDAAAAFQRQINDIDIPHTLERVSQLTDPPEQTNTELTPQQREALVVAYEAGYFAEPRRTSLGELADRLGISPSSASGRLRRGHATLIEEHFECLNEDRPPDRRYPLVDGI